MSLNRISITFLQLHIKNPNSDPRQNEVTESKHEMKLFTDYAKL